MISCRKALVESDGDFEKPSTICARKDKRLPHCAATARAKEGVIIATTTPDNKTGFIVTLACETDFVAKNTDFIAFAQSIVAVALKNNVKSA